MTPEIVIIDFGSQYTKLIARKIREARVYCTIAPARHLRVGDIEALAPKALIVSGGPACAAHSQAQELMRDILAMGKPVLGICFGLQLMGLAAGARLHTDSSREYGHARLQLLEECQLFAGITPDAGGSLQVWMSHADSLSTPPEGYRVVASSANAPFAAIADADNKHYALQFHPEVTHTPAGAQILRNFLFEVAGVAADWRMASFREEKIRELRAQTGSGKVLCALSGGVDSAVTAALLSEAIGDRLTCVMVDTGLLRLDEARQVKALFDTHYRCELRIIDAGDTFFARLAGVTDPEKKRKIIGETFIRIFEKVAQDYPDMLFLAQGTLYPDVIESLSTAGDKNITIKSHHNVGGLPERMNLQLIEPLRMLFKDEVRELGEEIGLPRVFLRRHPFPGPGLAIRIPGEVDRTAADLLRAVDAIYLEMLHEHGLYDAIWQAFAVLLPVHSVGVMGDNRSYERVIALRAVTSADGMTAAAYPFTHAFLEQAARRIVNETNGVNRVVYDVTGKPPGTIEWE